MKKYFYERIEMTMEDEIGITENADNLEGESVTATANNIRRTSA
jgi:hypothetical protein